MKMNPKNLLPQARQKAMTLVEVVISMAVGTAMLAMAMAAGADMYKKFLMERSYVRIHSEARRAMALLNKDIRTSLTITNALGTTFEQTSTNRLHLVQPDYALVEYKIVQTNMGFVNANVPSLMRNAYNSNGTLIASTILTRDATSIQFSTWRRPGTEAWSIDSTCEVRVQLVISNVFITNTLGNITTDRILLRTLLRTKNI